MRQLKFVRLMLESFKCYRRQVLDLAPGPGLYFLRGRNLLDPRLGANGVGKSTLFDALSWCLYGRTPRGLRTPDVIPWEANGPTRVALYFEMEGERHALQRRAAPNALILDGQAADQAALERLIGMSFPIFCHLVLFGQAVPLFYDLTPGKKLDVLVEALNADRWERYSALTAELAQQLAANLQQQGKETARLEGEVKALQDQAAYVEAQSMAWHAEQQKQARGAEAELRQKQIALERAIQNRDAATLALDSAETELGPVQAEYATALSKQRAAEARWDWLAERARSTKKQLVLATDEKICPLCRRPLHDKTVIRQLRTSVEEQAAELDGAVAERYTATNAVERTAATVKDFRDKAEAAATSLRLLGPQCAKLQAEVRALQQTLRRLEESNPHSVTLREVNTDLQAARKLLAKQAAAGREAEAALTRTQFWVKGFKDVRLFVIEQVLPELQMSSNALLTSLGLEGWMVRYTIEKELKGGGAALGLTTLIQSPDSAAGRPVRWENWSGGEGQRLRLGGEFALGEVLANHIGVEPNLEIVDEPSRHIAAEGMRDVAELLAARAARLKRTIWVADHVVSESAAFSGWAEVVKDARGSRVIVGDLAGAPGRPGESLGGR